MASNTGASSPGELEITCSTSEVAVCCSRASASSRVRALTCCCRSASVELGGRAAVGALFRLGFVVLACCVFAGLRLIVQRRLAEPFPRANDRTLPHHGVRCASQPAQRACRALVGFRVWHLHTAVLCRRAAGRSE